MNATSIKRFRQTALQLEGASEGAHQGHADFRVGGRVFATLGYLAKEWGMVKLTPDQQAMVVAAEPEIFRPVPGGWGKNGATNINLAATDPTTLRSALTMAWENVRSEAGSKTTRVKTSTTRAKKVASKQTPPRQRAK